jgi:FkbM family methyltransferase
LSATDTAAARPGLLERLLLAYARGFPLRRGKLRVVDALWRAAAGDDAHRLADIRFGGLRIPCDLNEMLQRQYYFFGTYFAEETILAAWSAAAREARVVFDVGASSGIYALAALTASPRAVAHAFEPTPEIAERLRRIVVLNGLQRLVVHEAAVFDRDGVVALRRCGREFGCNEGMNFVLEHATQRSDAVVTAVTLDRKCAQLGIERIDLLKLDIQGAEAAALAGAASLIDAGRIGMVFLELNWDPSADCPATRSIDRLARAGYLFSAPGPRLSWRPAGAWLRRLRDVVAKAPGVARSP